MNKLWEREEREEELKGEKGAGESQGYLVLVHHILQAGESMDAYIHVLVLDGPHGELQCCLQVCALGRLLQV